MSKDGSNQPIAQSLLTLNPSLRRAFGLMQRELDKGEAAFILGAGVDILIALDFVNNKANLPPNWTSLITGLTPFREMTDFSFRKKAQLRRITETWPTEAASLARWWSGDAGFRDELKRRLDVNPAIVSSIQSDLTEEKATFQLCLLLVRSNLIVTSNYSSYVVEALRAFCERQKLNKAIVVLDREDMQSLPFPERDEKNTIFVIHLHGRCSDRSFPILDAWGYNIVGHDDTAYIGFLRDLFTRRSVITIGSSWSDPPLRSAAAFVQRTKPYLSRQHLAFYFVSDKKTFGNVVPQRECNDLTRGWTNVMRAAYGVNILFVDRETQPQWFMSLNAEGANKDESSRSWNISTMLVTIAKQVADIKNGAIPIPLLKQCADFFDCCGDYESPLQHEFLSTLGAVVSNQAEKSQRDQVIRANTRKGSEVMVNLLKNFVKSTLIGDPENWQIAARIERHLRHHSYLYVRPLANNPREEIWRELWMRIPELPVWALFSSQLRFDFLVGRYELRNQVDVNLATYEQSLEHLSARFEKAKLVWNKWHLSEGLEGGKPWEERALDIQKLADDLLELGWESAAAKTLCDRVHLLSTTASNGHSSPESPIAKEIVEQAHQANSIARSAGCFRRQIKADSIGAMWNPDPFEGRVQLLGNIRAAEAMKSIEPGILGGLGGGLLVCELRAKQRSGKKLESIQSIANDLFEEIGLKGYLNDALEYWIKFAPHDIKLMLNKLAESVLGTPPS